MDQVSLAIFAAVLLAVFLRTAVPFAIKHKREKRTWEWKYLGSGLVSIFFGSIPLTLSIFAGIEILPEWNWWEAFAVTFLAVSGLNDLLNRYGLTLWKKEVSE